MTISNTTRRTSVVGNNTIGQEVTIPFEYTADSEISVITRLIATGDETKLTKDVDYTLSTGLVTTLKAYANTYQIHVVRNTLLTQTTDLEQGGAFNAETVEAQLDKATMQAIDNADALNRSLKAPVTDAATLDIELPNSTERASSFLYFDANGEPAAVNALTAGDLAISAYGTTLVAQASAEDARTTLGLSTSDGLGNLGVTAFAKTILDDANAAATRTTLELGDVALLTKSTDGTMADNSDALIPTQKAVKTLVQAALDSPAFENWTPVLAQNTTVATSVASGRVLKLGSLVVAYGVITASGTGTNGQPITVTGLPYDISATAGAIGGFWYNDYGTKLYPGVALRLSDNGLHFFAGNGGGEMGSGVALAIGANDNLSFYVVYEQAAV